MNWRAVFLILIINFVRSDFCSRVACPKVDWLDNQEWNTIVSGLNIEWKSLKTYGHPACPSEIMHAILVHFQAPMVTQIVMNPGHMCGMYTPVPMDIFTLGIRTRIWYDIAFIMQCHVLSVCISHLVNIFNTCHGSTIIRWYHTLQHTE